MSGVGRAAPHTDDAERVKLEPPDISAHRAGNTGIPYVTTLDSGHPGPHVAISAVMHGNEVSGAIAVDHLLQSSLSPHRGKLSLVFANVSAFETFDLMNPNASRFINEDMNRLWADGATDGRKNVERSRVQILRPFFDTVDMLLAGPSDKGRDLARSLESPAVIVCDTGHANGMRLRNFGRFNSTAHPHASILAECGQHWRAGTDRLAIDTYYRFLQAAGMITADVGAAHIVEGTLPNFWVEVTDSFVPRRKGAAFVEPFIGMEAIAEAGTPIAHDSADVIRTPYDDYVLIMPTRRLAVGQTAVRLGRRHMFDG